MNALCSSKHYYRYVGTSVNQLNAAHRTWTHVFITSETDYERERYLGKCLLKRSPFYHFTFYYFSHSALFDNDLYLAPTFTYLTILASIHLKVDNNNCAARLWV